MISFNVFLQRSLQLRYLSQSFLVNVKKFAGSRDLALEILVGKHNSPVHKVTENGNELAVVTLLEILPAEIVILGFRSIGSKDIPHDILLSRELLQILVSPDSPVLGSRNLVTLEIKELICRHIVRKDVAIAISLQH